MFFLNFKDILQHFKSILDPCLKRIMLFKILFHHISLWRLNFWKLLKIHCWLEIALFANFDWMRTTSYLLWIHRGLLHILSLPKHMLPVHQPAKQFEKKIKKICWWKQTNKRCMQKITKVQILWVGHKIWKNLPYFSNYLLLPNQAR